MRKLMTATAVMAFVSGCASVQGPPQIINARGVLPSQQPSGQTGDLIANFRDAAVAAAAGDAGETEHGRFMRAGFTLVYARCNDYFWYMGHNQTRARVLRDTVAPVVTLLTGIISLRDFTSNPGREQDLLQALSLGSGFATAGLDIYDRHFLFGAENINSVRELTLNALAVHRAAALNLPVTNFEQAAIHLIDHQSYCTPPKILSLTREAIAEERLESRITGGAAAREELDLRRALGNALAIGRALTAAEAFAMWWLLTVDTPVGERQALYEYVFTTYLSDIPDSARPITRSGAQEPYVLKPLPSNFDRLLRSLPAETVSAFDRRLEVERERVGQLPLVPAQPAAAPLSTEAAAPAAAPEALPALPSLAPTAESDGFQRVVVTSPDGS